VDRRYPWRCRDPTPKGSATGGRLHEYHAGMDGGVRAGGREGSSERDKPCRKESCIVS